jgi:F0F1-type ATP synthase membrane subunit b/b'
MLHVRMSWRRAANFPCPPHLTTDAAMCLQAKSQKMQEDYERQLQEMEESREKALEELTEYYDTRLQEMTAKLEQVFTRFNFKYQGSVS